MAVTETYAPVREAGNGVKVAFDANFTVIQATDVKVGKILNSTGVKTDMVYGVDYTVAVNASTKLPTVTYTVAPTALQDSWIGREVPNTQTNTIPTNNVFREVQVNNALDKQCMITQQLQEEIDRCVKLPEASSGVIPVLPTPEDGRILAWDGTSGLMKNTDLLAGPTGPTGPAGAAGTDGVFSAIASQAEAEAGTENTKGMTALRTAQAIAAQGLAETGWTDYSAISTIVGWGSFGTKQIFYKRVGDIVFVQFVLNGTSDNATTTFTLPFTKSSGIDPYVAIRAVDNGGSAVVAIALINGTTTPLVNLYKDGASSAFTNSGTKNTSGMFFYTIA